MWRVRTASASRSATRLIRAFQRSSRSVKASSRATVAASSGGGFPGLVLAIAARRPFHLVESDRRKAAFLTEAAARLGLPHVQVHSTRIEATRLPPLAALTARALAPLCDLVPHAARLLAPGGIALFPKGRTAEDELTATLLHWKLRVMRFASRTAPDATIFHLSEIRRDTPAD